MPNECQMTTSESEQALLACLAQRKETIVARWTEQTLLGHAEQRFLQEERDRFEDPVGHAIKTNLPRLFDALLYGATGETVEPALEAIVRVRAVQEQVASQAVSFVFLFKEIARLELKRHRNVDSTGGAMASLEARVDRMALHALDLFMKCRERIHDIRANEARRRVFVHERIALLKSNKGQS